MHDDRPGRAGVRSRCVRGGRHRGGGESASYCGCGQARPGKARRTVEDRPPGRLRAPSALRQAISRRIRMDL
jgi:hypothetical protein